MTTSSSHRPRRSGYLALLFLAGASARLWGEALVPEISVQVAPQPFRIGMSDSVFPNVNQDDAIASITVWLKAVSDEEHLGLTAEPRIYHNFEDLKTNVLTGRCDMVTLTSLEYFDLAKDLEPHELFAPKADNRITEKYVLIVSKNARFRKLQDLENGHIILDSGVRATLSKVWLEVILNELGLPPADRFFKRIDQKPKLSRTILPVFFEQADACLTTLSGFETIGELNPQVIASLGIIRSSRPLVPRVSCLLPAFQHPARDSVVEAIESVHQHPRGAQVMMFFKTDQIAIIRSEDLATTMETVRRYRSLSVGDLRSRN